MYERYYGLREHPFKLTSNPRYLLLTPSHAEGLSVLLCGIGSRRGIVVLTGEAGTGKTTVIRAAIASQPASASVVLIRNPRLTRSEFLEHLALGFGLSGEAATSKTRLLTELGRTLEASLEQGHPNALIIDEAHELAPDLLDEIRLLSNLETDDHKLLPVVLAGLPVVADRLQEPRYWQLTQRVVLRCALARLQPSETAAYVAGRIRVAGGDAATVFTHDAVEVVQQHARGLPRTINVICDNALIAGFAADERPVDARTVQAVCRDLHLRIPESDEVIGERHHARTEPVGPPGEDGRPGSRADVEPDAPARTPAVHIRHSGRFFS